MLNPLGLSGEPIKNIEAWILLQMTSCVIKIKNIKYRPMKVFVISSMMLCLSSSIWGQASSDDIVNHIENNMVEVKGGTFMMGQTHVVENESKIITRVASSTIDDDSPRADELPATV